MADWPGGSTVRPLWGTPCAARLKTLEGQDQGSRHSSARPGGDQKTTFSNPGEPRITASRPVGGVDHGGGDPAVLPGQVGVEPVEDPLHEGARGAQVELGGHRGAHLVLRPARPPAGSRLQGRAQAPPVPAPGRGDVDQALPGRAGRAQGEAEEGVGPEATGEGPGARVVGLEAQAQAVAVQAVAGLQPEGEGEPLQHLREGVALQGGADLGAPVVRRRAGDRPGGVHDEAVEVAPRPGGFAALRGPPAALPGPGAAGAPRTRTPRRGWRRGRGTAGGCPTRRAGAGSRPG